MDARIAAGFLVATLPFLFTFALDPFLHDFAEQLKNKSAGIIRACADDLGAALKYLRGLLILEPIFSLAQALAGLTLKPKKCVLIILAPLSEEVEKRIKLWLTANIPRWADFSISDQGKYLGFHLGPKAGTKIWAGPMAKYSDRV